MLAKLIKVSMHDIYRNLTWISYCLIFHYYNIVIDRSCFWLHLLFYAEHVLHAVICITQ
jgi:hypothetical protein